MLRIMLKTNALRYPCEKFHDAIVILAVGAGDVRSRLRDAYHEIALIKSQWLPEHLRRDFDAIIARLTKYPAEHQHEGRVDASTRRMKNETGMNLAIKIVNVWDQLEGLYDEADRRAMTRRGKKE